MLAPLAFRLALLLGLAPAPGCDALPAERGDPGLYCLDLVPVPDLESAAGHVVLVPAPSPFGASVAADGSPAWLLEFELAALPPAASLGGRHYVAWVTTPLLERVTRLGTVGNGVTRLGPVTDPKFTVFVSVEHDSAPAAFGRLVLRGLSPSQLVRPHGGKSLPAQRVEHAHEGHAPRDGWELPPMHPAAPAMTPGLEALVPSVTPWRPGAGIDPATLPPPRPRELRRLRDGDTLRLEAGLVRRTVAGRTFVAYAFNGQSPGPLLEAAKGTRVHVEFTNRLDLPTAVHWHGLRHDWRMDGAVGVSQAAVPPGGHFRYELRFPDAGVFWYHPHVREDIQQELGLYGNILVRTPGGGTLGPVHREEVLVLDDLLLGEAGPLPFGAEHATHALMGRMGNVFLVNGEPRWSLTAATGEVVRLYLTNTSNTRVFNLSLPGARMKVVAGDLSPFAREAWVESVVIAPAERYVVDVRFARAGTVPLVNRVQGIHPVARAFMEVADTLGAVTVTRARARPDLARAFGRLRDDATVAAEAARHAADAARAPDRELVVTMRQEGLPFGLVQSLRLDTAWVAPVEWAGLMPMMDWLSTGREVRWILRDPATGRENMDIDWRFARGTRLKLRLTSDRHTLHPMQHPIHLHGQRMLVLARNGVAETHPVWKDTVLLPAGATVDLLVELDNPGRWMLHCHIAEHLETGMHAVWEVGE